MRLNVKYDINQAARVILQEKLEEHGIRYEINGLGEVQITGDLSPEVYKSRRKYQYILQVSMI